MRKLGATGPWKRGEGERRLKEEKRGRGREERGERERGGGREGGGGGEEGGGGREGEKGEERERGRGEGLTGERERVAKWNGCVSAEESRGVW